MGFFVYVHTCKLNGKRYVGITQQKTVERRWRSDGSGYSNCPRFWNAIQKYGWENFDHEIIASNLTEEQACEWEISLIALFKSNHSDYGYNLADGGKYNTMPMETRLRMSRERKGRWCGKDNPNYGNHKLAGANHPNYGKHFSEEIRKKMSEGRKGKGPHTFSEEHKQKLRENHGGGSEKKRVICLETGVIYESINDAARKTNINKKMISNCCRKVPHYNTAKGCHWAFC